MYTHRKKWKLLSQNMEFRAIIKFLTKEDANPKEIHRPMSDVNGDSSPKYSTVAKWSAKFKNGRDSLDDPLLGHPADVISQMVDCVETLVLTITESMLLSLLQNVVCLMEVFTL